MPIRHIPDPSLTQPPSAFPEILDRAIAAAEAEGETLDILPLDVAEATEEAAIPEAPAEVLTSRNNKMIIALIVVFVVLPLIVMLFSIFLLLLGGVFWGVTQS